MEMKECPVCKLKRSAFFLRKDGCDFLKCQNCTLIFMDPLPTVERLADDFLTEKSGWHLKLNKDLSKIKKPRKDLSDIVNKLINAGIRGNLLDVGCCNGELMFLAKENGFNTFGVEINRDSSKIAINNGLNVFVGKLQEANFPSDYFSVICLIGVIEDVPNPELLLQECWRILKSGGIIVVATLNSDCFWVTSTEKISTWFKFPWPVIIPYYRLFLFSEKNLKNLLLESRFKVKDIVYSLVDLKHELGATGLFQEFKKEGSIKSLCYLILVFSVYSFIYLINFLLSPFLTKDFLITFFAEKA